MNTTYKIKNYVKFNFVKNIKFYPEKFHFLRTFLIEIDFTRILDL